MWIMWVVRVSYDRFHFVLMDGEQWSRVCEKHEECSSSADSPNKERNGIFEPRPACEDHDTTSP